MDSNDKKYSYNRFGMKGKRVGQAVHDIISKDQPECTVEEILDASSQEYVKQIENAIKSGQEKGYHDPFYIFVLTKKEMWAENVVRNFFIPRQSAPYALDMMCEYPHHTKTLYMVESTKGEITVLWTLPGIEECKSILRQKHIYDPQLVKWIEDCMDKKLDLDSYDEKDL